MNQYVIKTLGCKANLYDSQLIEAELRKRGWQSGAEVDLCIVNSCTVTDEADRQTRKLAARLARENPSAAVVVTGCAAEVDPERIANSKGVHYVIGNRDKPTLVDQILQRLASQRDEKLNHPDKGEVLGVAKSYSEIMSRHPIDREWPEVSEFSGVPLASDAQTAKTRAFIKIQEGCNSFCTYCIIPYGRGPSRSLRPRELVDQVRNLVDHGIKEIVITGTNIGDYGTDWGDGSGLVSLCETILKDTRLERLRVSSLDPVEIEPALTDLMKSESRFCPHFHVSLQSPHSKILRLMKRKYNSTHVQECLERIAALPAPVGGVFVGMDVITGFPGEGEEEFAEGLAMLKSLPWTRLHVFPYSERAGTPATRLPGAVKQEERVRRARELNRLSLGRMNVHYEKTLQALKEQALPLDGVLLERATRPSAAPLTEVSDSSQLWMAGYTSNYLRVFVPVPRGMELRNELVRVHPVSVFTDPQSSEAAFLGTLV